MVTCTETSSCFGALRTRPSSLDVALFAHLARVRQYPDTLHYLVDDYPYLMKFFDQFMLSYFSPVENKENVDLSTNLFILQQHLKIEKADKKFCFTTRKTPCNGNFNPLKGR